MLGPALFVAVAGPGRWSADHEVGAEGDPDEARRSSARCGCCGWRLALALIIVAFREKLASPRHGAAFLAEEPQFNVAQGIGLGVSDLEFTRLAGGVEVLFGLLLISGALPQAVVIIAGIPFNATLYFLGTRRAGGPPADLRHDARAAGAGVRSAAATAVSTLWPWGARQPARGS